MKKTNVNLRFARVTEMQICKIVMEMKPKLSSGLDGISNMLLKRLIHVIKGPLCTVFNKSLSSGVFPAMLKSAKVVPLYKGGSDDLLDNYRPISLLPVISKILEKVVFKSLMTHLTDNNLLYERQYGFRPNRSTTDAVTNLVGEILTSFEDNQMVLALFVDLKKAFDTVSHEIILSKLSCLGVNDIELCWFRSYLTNRYQRVQINKSVSDEVLMTVGVPQGALLGVVLFMIQIDDLFRSLRFSTSILYADDTTIIVKGHSLRFLRAKMQSEINNLTQWLELNNLNLNS